VGLQNPGTVVLPSTIVRRRRLLAVDPGADSEISSTVVVPRLASGQIVPLSAGARSRDEIDEALDDLLGVPDDSGPGLLDGALLVGGIGAVVAGQAGSLPTSVTVIGLLTAGLGSVLPIRWLARRVGARRRAATLRALVGDGRLLRTDHPAVGSLVSAAERLRRGAALLAEPVRSRVIDVAHSAVYEVASLLDGRRLTTLDEAQYAGERVDALADLERAVAQMAEGEGDADRRRSMVEARREIEQVSRDSSVVTAGDLARELSGHDDV
jgi:hypothetical protein